MWTAHVTLNADYPPRARPGVLHLMIGPTTRPDAVDVTATADFARFLYDHQEIGTVIVYGSRFPKRPIEFRWFIEKHSRKLWKDSELLTAMQAEERRRVADPNYTPTVAQALRNPKEFVEGMTQE